MCRLLWWTALAALLPAATRGQGGQFELTVIQYQHPVTDKQDVYTQQVADAIRLARSHGQGNVLVLNTGGTRRAMRRQFRVPDVSPAATAFSKEDFNGGISSLMARVVGSPETFVVSNIRSSLLRRFVADSTVVDIGGKTVGVVGFVSRYLNQKLLDAGSMPIVAEVPAVQREVRRLKERGVDIVIALGSAGHRRNAEIAREVRGLDAVVTGPVETRAAATESFPQAIEQPWGTVVPLLEIPLATDHLIGITRLLFDDTNQVTKGVGMFTVADGTNRDAVEQKQLALLEMDTVESSGQGPAEALEALGVAASQYSKEQADDVPPPSVADVVTATNVESADGGNGADEVFIPENQPFVPPFTAAQSEGDDVVRKTEKGPLSAQEALVLKEQLVEQAGKGEKSEEQMKEDVSSSDTEATVDANDDVKDATVNENQSAGAPAVTEISPDQNTETLTAAEVQELKSNLGPLTAAQVEALKDRFVVVNEEDNQPGSAVLVDKNSMGMTQSSTGTVTAQETSDETSEKEAEAPVVGESAETSNVSDDASTPLAPEVSENNDATTMLVMKDKNAESGMPPAQTVAVSVQLGDAPQTADSEKETNETGESDADQAMETMEKDTPDSSMAGDSSTPALDETNAEDIDAEVEGSGNQNEVEADNDEVPAPGTEVNDANDIQREAVETPSETVIASEEPAPIQSDNVSADSIPEAPSSEDALPMNDVASSNDTVEPVPQVAETMASSETADSVQDEVTGANVEAVDTVPDSASASVSSEISDDFAENSEGDEAVQPTDTAQDPISQAAGIEGIAVEAQGDTSDEMPSDTNVSQSEAADVAAAADDDQNLGTSEEAAGVAVVAQDDGTSSDIPNAQDAIEQTVNESPNTIVAPSDAAQDPSPVLPGEATTPVDVPQEQLINEDSQAIVQDQTPVTSPDTQSTSQESVASPVQDQTSATDGEDELQQSTDLALGTKVGIEYPVQAYDEEDAGQNLQFIDASLFNAPEPSRIGSVAGVLDAIQAIVGETMDSDPTNAISESKIDEEASPNDAQPAIPNVPDVIADAVNTDSESTYVSTVEEAQKEPQMDDASEPVASTQDTGAAVGDLNLQAGVEGEPATAISSTEEQVPETTGTGSQQLNAEKLSELKEEYLSGLAEKETGGVEEPAPAMSDEEKLAQLQAQYTSDEPLDSTSGSQADDTKEASAAVEGEEGLVSNTAEAAQLPEDDESVTSLQDSQDSNEPASAETSSGIEVSSDSGPAVATINTETADAGSDSEPAEVSVDSETAEGSSATEPAEVGSDAETSDAETVEVNSNTEPAEVSSDAGMTSDTESAEISPDIEPAVGNTDAETIEMSSDSQPAEMNSDAESAEVSSTSTTADLSPVSETAEVNSDAEPVAVSSDAEPADMSSDESVPMSSDTEPAEISSDTQPAEVSSDSVSTDDSFDTTEGFVPESVEASSDIETAGMSSDAQQAEVSSDTGTPEVRPDTETAEVSSNSEPAEVGSDAESANDSSDSESAAVSPNTETAQVSSDTETAVMSSDSKTTEMSSDSETAEVIPGSETAAVSSDSETAEMSSDAQPAEVSSDTETAEVIPGSEPAEAAPGSEDAVAPAADDVGEVNPNSGDEVNSASDPSEVNPDAEAANPISDSDAAALIPGSEVNADGSIPETTDVSSTSETADSSPDSESAEVSPDAGMSSDSEPAEVSSDAETTGVSSETEPAEVSSDTETAEVSSNAEPTEMSSDADPNKVVSGTETDAVSSDNEPAQVSSDAETAGTSPDPDMVGVTSDDQAAEDSSDMASAGESSDSVAAEINSDSGATDTMSDLEAPEVISDVQNAEMSSDAEPDGVNPDTETPEVNPDIATADVSSDADAGEASSGSETAEMSPGSETADMSSDSDAVEVSPDVESAEVSSDSVPADVSAGDEPAKESSDAEFADVSPVSETAEVSSDSEAPEVNSDAETDEMSKVSETAEVSSSDAEPAPVNSDSEPMRSGADTAEVSADAEPTELSSDSETPEVNADTETVSSDSDTASQTAEVSPVSAEVSSDTAEMSSDSQTPSLSSDAEPMEVSSGSVEASSDTNIAEPVPTSDNAETDIASEDIETSLTTAVLPANGLFWYPNKQNPQETAPLDSLVPLTAISQSGFVPSRKPDAPEQQGYLPSAESEAVEVDKEGILQTIRDNMPEGVVIGEPAEIPERAPESESADASSESVMSSDMGASPENEVSSAIAESSTTAEDSETDLGSEAGVTADAAASPDDGVSSVTVDSSATAVNPEAEITSDSAAPVPDAEDAEVIPPGAETPLAEEKVDTVSPVQTEVPISEPEEPSSVQSEGPSPVQSKEPMPAQSEDTSQNQDVEPAPVQSEEQSMDQPQETSPVQTEGQSPVQSDSSPVQPQVPSPAQTEEATPMQTEVQSPVQTEEPFPLQPQEPVQVPQQEPSPVQPIEPIPSQPQIPPLSQITSPQNFPSQPLYGQSGAPAQSATDVINTIQGIVTEQQEQLPSSDSPALPASDAASLPGGAGDVSGVISAIHGIVKEETAAHEEVSGDAPVVADEPQTAEPEDPTNVKTEETEVPTDVETEGPTDVETEVPTKMETGDTEVPTNVETGETQVPSEAQTGETEVPTEAQTEDAELPTEVQNGEAGIPTEAGSGETEGVLGTEFVASEDLSQNEIAQPEDPLDSELAEPEDMLEPELAAPEDLSPNEIAEPEAPLEQPADAPQYLPQPVDSETPLRQPAGVPAQPAVVPQTGSVPAQSGSVPAQPAVPVSGPTPGQRPFLPSIPSHVTEDELMAIISQEDLSSLGLSQSQLLALLTGSLPAGLLPVSGQEAFVPVRSPGAVDAGVVPPSAYPQLPTGQGVSTGSVPVIPTSPLSPASAPVPVPAIIPVSAPASVPAPGTPPVREDLTPSSPSPSAVATPIAPSPQSVPSPSAPASGAPSPPIQSVPVTQGVQTPTRDDPVLGVTAGQIAGELTDCLGTECAMGKIIADALRWRLRAEVEGTFVASDVFRGSWQGEIRRSDIIAVVRNNPRISIVTIEGSRFEDFIRVLEGSPLFFHMSGVRLTVSPQMDISVSVLCEGCGPTPYQPINTAKPYVLAFLTGADNRLFESAVFADVRPLTLSLTDDVLVPYVEANRFVSPPTDDRIIFAGTPAPTRVDTSADAPQGAAPAQRPAQLLTEEDRLEALKQQYLSDILAVAEDADAAEGPTDPQQLLQQLTELQQQYQQAAPAVVAAATPSDLDQLALLQQEYAPAGAVASVAPVRAGSLAPAAETGQTRPIGVTQSTATQSQTPAAELTDIERLALLQQQYAQADESVAPVRAGSTATTVPVSSGVQTVPSRPAVTVQRRPVIRPADPAEPPADELTKLQELFALQQQYGATGTAPDPATASQVNSVHFGSAAPGAEVVPQTSVPHPSVPQTSVPRPSVPHPSVPRPSVPRPSVPHASVQQTSVPRPSVPYGSVQQTSVPYGSVQQTSVPYATVQQTSVPHPSVQQTSVPYVSVPQYQQAHAQLSSAAPGVEYVQPAYAPAAQYVQLSAPHQSVAYSPGLQQVHLAVGSAEPSELAEYQEHALTAYQHAVAAEQSADVQVVRLVEKQVEHEAQPYYDQVVPHKPQYAQLVQQEVQPQYAQVVQQEVPVEHVQVVQQEDVQPQYVQVVEHEQPQYAQVVQQEVPDQQVQVVQQEVPVHQVEAQVVPTVQHVVKPVHAQGVAQALHVTLDEAQPASEVHVSVARPHHAETAALQQAALVGYQQHYAPEKVQTVVAVPQEVQHVQQVQHVQPVQAEEYVEVVPHVLASTEHSAPYATVEAVHVQQYTPQQVATLLTLQQQQQEDGSGTSISSLLAQKLKTLQGMPAKAVLGFPVMLLLASLTAGALI